MIDIIPRPTPNYLKGLTPGERQIIKKIKEIYKSRSGDNFLYIQPRLRNLEPDFILIDSEKGVAILEIKDWSINYISTINRIKVTSKNGKTLHNPIFRTNQYFNFAKGLFEIDTRLYDNEGLFAFPIYCFTNSFSASGDSK